MNKSESTFRWERAVTPTWTTSHDGSLVATAGATGCQTRLLEELKVGEKRQLQGYGGRIFDIERLT